jgi:hypothetical protein
MDNQRLARFNTNEGFSIMKIPINMIGGGFYHDICSSAGSEPKLIEWKKDNSADISIHIDYHIQTPVDKNKKNYAWLSESRTINPSLYNWCIENVNYLNDTFELIFTNDKSLLKLSPKFKQVICSARPWIKECALFPKTKLVSMIASNKSLCPEHNLRTYVIDKFKNQIDLYGRGYVDIADKSIGLKDYYFSICMENLTYSNGYSEKISDCFATGTIPIYYGSPDIVEVFNKDGIIWLTEEFKIEDLSAELYWSKLDAIKDNFERAINFPIAEDWIYETYIK